MNYNSRPSTSFYSFNEIENGVKCQAILLLLKEVPRALYLSYFVTENI